MSIHTTLKELRKKENPIILGNLYYNIHKNEKQTEKVARKWTQNIDDINLPLDIITNKKNTFLTEYDWHPLFNDDLSLENSFIKICIENLRINRTTRSIYETYCIIYNLKNKTIGSIEFGVSFIEDGSNIINTDVKSRRFQIITTTGIFNPYSMGTVEIFYNNTGVATRTITFKKK